MGEMAVGCGGPQERREQAGAAGGGKAGGERSVRWEAFLKQVCVRVLLVEADDATRSVTAALLRKCSYRVAATADGLKAWETLKEKSQNIDLVLTEVDLPSISGCDLLTMIMEHETCKNIPVIMMSSHDSINMVLKCMLKGAANFLIKPIRKNEIRNLWLHVWRRHLSDGLPRGTYKHQDENLIQRKSGSNSENNAAGNYFRDRVAYLQIEKGCNTQSSCTRPDMDAESEYTQNIRENIQSDCISSSVVNDTRNHKDDVCDKLDEDFPLHESETEGCTGDANIQHEEKKKGICHSKPFREADLIGAMDKHSQYSRGFKKCDELRSGFSDCAEILDDDKDEACRSLSGLTLRKHHTICTEKQEKDNMLNHSTSSAFSRYIRTAPSPPSTSDGFRTDVRPPMDQGLSQCSASRCSGAPLTVYLQDDDSLVGGLPNPHRRAPCSHLGLLPIPVPMSGTAYGLLSGYVPVMPPLFYAKSGTPVWNLKPTTGEATHSSLSHQSDRKTFSSERYGGPHGKTVQKHLREMHKEHTCNIQSLNERGHVASVMGQSRCNSSEYGSVCDDSDRNLTASNVSRSTLENAGGNGLFIHDEIKQADSHRSVVRQAALIKFRLKRKERPHEKEVHCQSRKRLAEEHLQVKGQFARQVEDDPELMEVDSKTAVDNCMPLPNPNVTFQLSGID